VTVATNAATYPVVAIDGPAGAGKSTVARRLAARLGFAYVNSGAIYRAVTWRVLRGARLADVLAEARIDFVGPPETQRVVVDGEDATAALHGPEVTALAATLSQDPAVRAYADALQRAWAARGPLVVEGRDAGSVVFPRARCKFYLDASLEARARRRLGDASGATPGGSLQGTRDAIAARDQADQTRAVAPLARATDATYIDSSDMTVDQVVEHMAREVERACSTAR
jgi:cytidylate kinase